MPNPKYCVSHIQCNRLLLIIAILFCHSVLAATEMPADKDPACSLEGVVKDTLGNLIPNATVLLENSGQVAVTDEEGHFCFESVPEGALTLLTTYKGFEERWIHGVQPGVEPVEIILEPARITESITVTAATRTEKRLEDVPIRTEVVMPQIIEMSSAKTLADAVEFTPGIRVENSCQNCNFSSIRMLGLQGPYTQILFDGQPTMSSLAQVYGVEHIPAQMVDRIEIVKGGGSSIYGSGSVGGVINIISHTPSRNSIHLESSAEWVSGTPVQTFGVVADWLSESRNTFLTAYSQNNNTNPMDFNDDAITEIADRKLSTSGLRFGKNFFDQSAKLTIDLSYMWEDRRGGSELDLPQDRAFLTEWVRSKRTAFGTSWFHSPNTDMDYRLSFSLANTDRDTYYGSNQDPNAYGDSDNPLWLIDGQVNNYLGSHILSWGGQFRSDSIRDTQPAYDRTTDETYHNAGAFIQDDWFFLDGFELVYGFRVDKHSALEDAIISPRAALMWSPTPEFRFRSSIATGFLAPQVFDEDLHITQVGGEGQIIRNDPNLKEESSTTYMLGMEWRPLIGPGNALLEANAFDTEIKDLFLAIEDDIPGTEEYEFTRVNHGKASVYGAEFNFGYGIPNFFQLEFGIVEQRARFHEPDPDFNSKDFFRTPNRYGVISLMYFNREIGDFFMGIRFEGQSIIPHYAGYIPEDRLETTPAWITLDASYSKNFNLPGSDRRAMNLTLGVKNLTDKFQDDIDRTIYRDAGYIWGPRSPRTIYVSLGFDL